MSYEDDEHEDKDCPNCGYVPHTRARGGWWICDTCAFNPAFSNLLKVIDRRPRRRRTEDDDEE